VLGVLATVLFSGTLVMANPVLREIAFGVNVSINGKIIRFEQDEQPFVMEERTFLPVRAIAYALGLEVGWDAETSTVLLTGGAQSPPPSPDPEQPQPPVSPESVQSSSFSAAMFDSGGGLGGSVTALPSVSMFGSSFENAVVYQSTSTGANLRVFSMHNLNGRYSRLVGTIGRVDGSGSRDIIYTIFGDGTILAQHEMTANDAPVSIDIDVTGVSLIRIEVGRTNTQGSGTAEYAVAARLYR